MLDILLYTSLITGGILVILLVLSLISGLDIDMDMGGNIDVDTGGIGYVKGTLTFFSIGAYIVRSILMSDYSPFLAFAIGIGAGLLAVFILSQFLRWLLRNQVNVNWKNEDAIFEEGTVYLKIEPNKTGIIKVEINGVIREIKAVSKSKKSIPTGSRIKVDEVTDNIATVSLM